MQELENGRGVKRPRPKLGCSTIEEDTEIQCTLSYHCANYLVC